MAKLRVEIALWLLIFWCEVVGWIGLLAPEEVAEGLVIYARGVLRGAGVEK